jgi:hypothetical protein
VIREVVNALYEEVVKWTIASIKITRAFTNLFLTISPGGGENLLQMYNYQALFLS